MKKLTPIIPSDEISVYLKEIKKIPVITHERSDEIFKLLKEETPSKEEKEKLYNEIIRGNLRFVISVAKLYQHQGLDLPDLISEGNMGLIKAIDRYDLNTGYKFISYAVWWVKQSILSALNEYGRTIRLPSNIIQDNQKQRKDDSADDQLIIGSHNPYNLPYTIELSTPINEDGDTLVDLIPNKNSLQPDEILIGKDDYKEKIRQILSVLDERERIIIDGYYGLSGVEKNLEDLGEEFGCTKERVRQLKDKSIKKLRNVSYDLMKYL